MTSTETRTPVTTPEGMSAQFHEAMGLPFGHGLTDRTQRGRELRARLHLEENAELVTELECNGSRPAIAKELADVVVVAYGTAHSLGIDLAAVLAEVHASNMTKFGPDGRSAVYRADGKLTKGPHYLPPDIAAVLACTDRDGDL